MFYETETGAESYEAHSCEPDRRQEAPEDLDGEIRNETEIIDINQEMEDLQEESR
jgi:hypothetical protein